MDIKRVSYPVSKEMCSECNSCHLITETIIGASFSDTSLIYQCISDMESICKEALETSK